MNRCVLFFCLFPLVLTSTDGRQFSQETREADVSFLDRVTLPFRQTLRFPWHPTQSLVDFLASRPGLAFLVANFQTLWYQELLEFEYGRSDLCENLRREEANTGSLTQAEHRFKSCLCNRYLPFLHCLAIGSQLLRDNGYLNEDMSEKILTDENLPEMVDEVPELMTDNEPEDKDGCIPHWIVKDHDLLYGGQCVVPVARLFKITFDDQLAVGTDELMYLDATKCTLCQGVDESDCQPVCKGNIIRTEGIVDTAKATLKSTVCIDLGRFGQLFRSIYAMDACVSEIDVELYFYQRVLKLAFKPSFGGMKVNTAFNYKFQDGPECICGLATFTCTKYCSMKRGALIGIVGLKWDLFFGTGSYERRFNDTYACYTRHIREPDDCPFPPGPQ